MGGFSSLLASILVPPSLNFEASSLDFEPSRLASGASWPAAFLWLCFTQLPAAMNVRSAKIPKTCQEKDVSHKWPDCQGWVGGGDPPRGFQSAGHRRCANSVPDSFPTGSVQSQLAKSRYSFAQFDLNCSFPYPFLSPGGGGPPQTRRQKAEKFGFFAFFLNFLPFRSALEK